MAKRVKKHKVGFIGLGIMGKPMVINLIKNDIEVYFYARKQQIIDEISKIGGKFIPSPSDISKFTKICITNLPNTKDVKNVVIGRNGCLIGDVNGMDLLDCAFGACAQSRIQAEQEYLMPTVTEALCDGICFGVTFEKH